MSDIYKLIHPIKFFNNYISNNSRPDGRSFSEQRNIRLNFGAITSADSSAIVKCGNTTVVCGIKLELATPKAEEPDQGYIVTNVEILPLCSPKFRPGPPSDHAQVVSKIISDIVMNSKCIDLKDLCIVSDKLAWVLHCDMVCIDNDGSLVDPCMISLITSLKTLSLPTVTFDPETEQIKVDADMRTPLKLHGIPVTTSFAIFTQPERSVLLTDPSAFEEEMCGGLGANLIITWNNEQLCGTHKFGGSKLSTEQQSEAFKISKDRIKIIKDVINTCIKNVN